MLEIARICCRIERSLRLMHHTRKNSICNARGSSLYAAARQQTSTRMKTDVHRCAAAISARQEQRSATPLRPATTPIKACSFALRMVHNSGSCDAADHRPEHRRPATPACAHVQSTGAAEPRRAKNFAFVTVQAVSFLASVATLRGC